MINPSLHSKSSYSFAFRTVKDIPFLMIEDLNKGMSVTNNIENIVAHLCNKYNKNPSQLYIIYKDSDGLWDGFQFPSIEFIPLQETHWLKAAMKMIKG